MKYCKDCKNKAEITLKVTLVQCGHGRCYVCQRFDYCYMEKQNIIEVGNRKQNTDIGDFKVTKLPTIEAKDDKVKNGYTNYTEGAISRRNRRDKKNQKRQEKINKLVEEIND